VRVHIGANFEGYELGRQLETWLGQSGHEVIWHGADFYDEADDYPLFAVRVGQAVIADEDKGLETRGVLVGGIGHGEVIAANKVNGTRAILGVSADFVRDAREHSNANIVVVGAKSVNQQTAQELITALFESKFKMILDDSRRLLNMAEFENSGTIEGWKIEG